MLDVLAVLGVDNVGQSFFTHILSFEQVESLELGETFGDRESVEGLVESLCLADIAHLDVIVVHGVQILHCIPMVIDDKGLNGLTQLRLDHLRNNPVRVQNFLYLHGFNPDNRSDLLQHLVELQEPDLVVLHLLKYLVLLLSVAPDNFDTIDLHRFEIQVQNRSDILQNIFIVLENNLIDVPFPGLDVLELFFENLDVVVHVDFDCS